MPPDGKMGTLPRRSGLSGPIAFPSPGRMPAVVPKTVEILLHLFRYIGLYKHLHLSILFVTRINRPLYDIDRG